MFPTSYHVSRTVRPGNIQVISGNIQVISGNIQVISGNIQVISGNIQVISGNIQVISGNIWHPCLISERLLLLLAVARRHRHNCGL
jgi:hypothetical protein